MQRHLMRESFYIWLVCKARKPLGVDLSTLLSNLARVAASVFFCAGVTTLETIRVLGMNVFWHKIRAEKREMA
jgi:hypothetical protein